MSEVLFTTKSRLALSQIPKKLNQQQIHTVRDLDNRRRVYLNTFCFDEAKNLSRQKNEYITRIHNSRMDQEKNRQKGEVEKFNEIFDKRKAKTIKELDKTREKEQKRWDGRKREMELLHERERTDFRSRYQQSEPKIRFSRKVILLMEKEEALLKAEHYEKSKRVRSHRLEIEEKERREIISSFKSKFRNSYKRLLDRQKWDLFNFERKKKKALIADERKRKERLALLKQQKKNMLFDMERSHRLEFQNIRIQRNKPVRTRTPRNTNTSSTRGDFAESFYGFDSNRGNLSLPQTSRPQTARNRTKKNVTFEDQINPRPSTSRGPRPSRRKKNSRIKSKVSTRFFRKNNNSNLGRKKGKRRESSSSYFGSILYEREFARGRKVVIPSLVDLYLLNDRDSIKV